jgi:hypothetical protein
MFDHHWFLDISRPSRYLGNEVNTIKKNPALTDVSTMWVCPT